MYFKKGDNVIVIAGKDKGKRGKVSRVFRTTEQVIVDGVNVKKRHRKSSRSGENQKGHIHDFAAPIHASNVSLVDPKSDKPTRVGMKIKENGLKVRVAKHSGEEI